MKSLKLENGITLIALVITIIILLILAGVSISMVIGENGIVNKAKKSKEDTEKAKVEEEEALKNLENEIENFVEGKKEIDFEQIQGAVLENKDFYLSKAQELGQDTTNNDIGIGTDGNVVDLDLWAYRVISNEYISLNSVNANGYNYSSYENSNINDDGTIKGKVPQYIYIYALDKFLTVTNLDGTFSGCTDLEVAPELPSTVTSMRETFMGCEKLIIAPTIPKGVTYLDYTFSGCNELEKCVIPSTIINIGKNTFVKYSANNNIHLYFEHTDALPNFGYVLADGIVYDWYSSQSNIIAYFKNSELAESFSNEFRNIEVSDNYNW